MQTGLHVVGVGVQRLAIAATLVVFGVILAYSALIFVIVAVQAVVAFGQ